jgi:hypothetical protein
MFNFIKNIFKKKSNNVFSELHSQIFKNEVIEDFNAGEKEVLRIFKNNISKQTANKLFKGALLRSRLAIMGQKEFKIESLESYLMSDLNCNHYVNIEVVNRFYDYIKTIHTASLLGRSTKNVVYRDLKEGVYYIVNNP